MIQCYNNSDMLYGLLFSIRKSTWRQGKNIWLSYLVRNVSLIFTKKVTMTNDHYYMPLTWARQSRTSLIWGIVDPSNIVLFEISSKDVLGFSVWRADRLLTLGLYRPHLSRWISKFNTSNWTQAFLSSELGTQSGVALCCNNNYANSFKL